MFEIEYGKHEMKTHQKLKIGPLCPEKYADDLFESPRVPCCYNASPGVLLNASWFNDGNLVPLIKNFLPAGWNAGRRKLTVHIDNASVHNSRITITQNFSSQPAEEASTSTLFPQ
jgi:hypothetical protein